MFKTVLLAYDGSDHADHAIKVAAEMVKAFDGKLHVSYTPQFDTPPVVVGAMIDGIGLPPSEANIQKAGQLVIGQAQEKAQAAGVNIAQSHIAAGNPAQNVLGVAEKIDADLIVMGRRGLGSLGALALGSVTQAVSHGAKCVCMTVA